MVCSILHFINPVLLKNGFALVVWQLHCNFRTVKTDEHPNVVHSINRHFFSMLFSKKAFAFFAQRYAELASKTCSFFTLRGKY